MKRKYEVAGTPAQFLPTKRSACMLFGVLAVCISTLLFSSRAHAECGPEETLPDTVVNFLPTVSVPPNTPPNTVVATVTVQVNGATVGKQYAHCSDAGRFYWQIQSGQNGANHVGSTTVEGIGYMATLSGGGLPDMTTNSSTNAANVAGGLATPTFSSQWNLTVKLVTTGAPIQPGPLSLNPTGPGQRSRVGIFYVGSSGGRLFSATMPDNATTITSAACSVTTPSSTLPLDPVSAGAFSGVGSTAGGASVSLGINCPNAASKVFVTLTDNASPTNVGNILSLRPDSTAGGVKLQIFNPDGTPVSFGPDSSVAGNTNQWLVGQAVSGQMSIPLTVKYIQTEQTIRGGTVNGVATFTMSYQ